MKMLLDIYNIYNPSMGEREISNYIQDRLTDLHIPYKVDVHHQIYSINPGEPLICAHMDAVSIMPCKHILVYKDRICGTSNFGADDKNGIWIILNILKEYPNLSFIFSTQEELGGKIGELPLEELESVPYALIFDRTGSGDIIGTYNSYCSEDLEDDIFDIGIGYGFSPERGVFSDCDELRYFVPCVNLSCGYYNAHTDMEYTVISELRNALDFGKAIIEGIPKDNKYELPNIIHRFGHSDYYTTGDWYCQCGCTNYIDDSACWYCGISYEELYFTVDKE